MNHTSTVPEYILEESEKIHPMERHLDSSNLNLDEVVVDLVQLEQGLALQADTLRKIQGLLHELVLSLQERV